MDGYFTETRKAVVPNCTFAYFGNRIYYGPINYSYSGPINRVRDYFIDFLKDPVETVYSYRTGSRANASMTNDDILASAMESKKVTSVSDTGHEFDSIKQSIVIDNKENEKSYSFGKHTPDVIDLDYVGPLFVGPAIGMKLDYPSVPDVSLTYGTKAINQTIPTSPNAGLSAFLGELKDGVPDLIGRAILSRGAHGSKKLGQEFLNYQFGIAPFISDFRKFINSVLNASKMIRQYQNESGTIQNRHFYFPTIRSTERNIISSGGGSYQTLADAVPFSDVLVGSGPPQSISLISKKTDRIWFKGSYMFNLAVSSDTIGKLKQAEQLANKLLGTRLTPSVLWQIAPWSWLADWVFNIGDIIDNATALKSDGLVLRYGYLMCESTYVNTYTVENSVYGGLQPRELSTSLVTTRKQRKRATPYGFGVSPDSFTGQQWAILGALGLTKSPNKLF